MRRGQDSQRRRRRKDEEEERRRRRRREEMRRRSRRVTETCRNSLCDTDKQALFTITMSFHCTEI